MQQRLAIARAILHSPRVLLLDEAHSGLDQIAAAQLDALLHAEAAAGRSVLLVTHDLQRGVALADRVLGLDRGRVVLERAAGAVSATELAALYAGGNGA
jgi:ABC-type multidrug transport system ATPase subunit